MNKKRSMTWIKIERYVAKKTFNNKILFNLLLSIRDFFEKIKSKFLGVESDAILLEDYKAIYFNVSKVGGTSIREVIKNLNSKSRYLKLSELNKYPNYFKFAFVRNPYDRVASCYFDKLKREKGRYEIKNIDESLLRYKGVYYNMPFKEFVKIISSIPDKKANYHIKSQYKFLTDKKGNIIVDYIAKFENFEQEFKKIFKRIGISEIPKLPHKNKSKKENKHKKYYDEETKRLIKKRYAKDLKLFGYKF